ncbi:MAG TPA: ATP-binding cassette domain-containing protein, partial [Steroidobacteraceae bacterium]|nr:ATP-binding cassette domain-containing protein [Steroidobacteraceae bacterium]
MLLRLDKISLSFGDRPLLDQVSLQLEEGERLALIGRNGEGKSSLLRVVLSVAEPDAGTLWRRPGARVSYLAQDLDLPSGQSVAEVVTAGLQGQRQALLDYQRLAAAGAAT